MFERKGTSKLTSTISLELQPLPCVIAGKPDFEHQAVGVKPDHGGSLRGPGRCDRNRTRGRSWLKSGGYA
ncbi:MAG TPA: hypothetical protein EYP67_02990 [Methanosarcinales archaeon]|nr:hypothetical protein [Methanosarcinales archaeon]